jgi:signal transduction histidine kinase
MPLASTDDELTRRAFDRIELGLAVLDEDSRVLLVNDAWRRLGGAAEGETHLDPGGPAKRAPVELAHEPKRFLVSIDDATHTGEVYAQLAQRIQALEHLNTESARLAAIATRDLQVPLRALNNLVLWLEEDLGTDREPVIAEHLHHMRSRLAVLSKMVASLVRYTRLGTQPTPLADVDVGTLLSSLARTLELPPKLVIEIDGAMPTLHASRASLRQVFAELINNAVAHHDTKEGSVRVRSQAMGTHWEFCIGDDGPGMQELLLLFDSLDQHASAGPTGIGLALARRIVQEHGGELRIDASAGHGARICFTWPTAPPR